MHILLCRQGFEGALCEELLDRGVKARAESSGIVSCPTTPPADLVFERQRLPEAGFVPLADLKPISDATLQAIAGGMIREPRRWTMHTLATGEDLARRAEGIGNTIQRLATKLQPQIDDLHRAPHRAVARDDVWVLQLVLTPQGLWHSLALITALTSRQPGGELRMQDDPAAPSRSYLKVEEAFVRMNEWPTEGQRVVDLGAAPGGWTWAFAKRGCDVLSVDNGPLKIPDTAGRVCHIMENGITYEPPASERPLDWMVADMLVAPGVAFGLLRRWLVGRWMRRFVVNIKLPQSDPYAALRPVFEILREAATHHGATYRVTQLYHDRREVTVMGRIGGT